MRRIDSLTNSYIKQLVSLHSPKGREEHRLYIAEGIRTIQTLIDYGHTAQTIYISDDQWEHAPHELRELSEITVVSTQVMRKISQATTPSGILATFSIPAAPEQPLESGIALAQIQDPGNMGTIIRTAVAMNKKFIVIVEGCDPWSFKVVQSSAGTIGACTILQTSWNDFIDRAREAQLNTCALVVSGGKNPREINPKNTLLIVGNEARGLPEQWQKQCSQLCTIPMPGETESLNASVAASIALYLVFSKS